MISMVRSVFLCRGGGVGWWCTTFLVLFQSCEVFEGAVCVLWIYCWECSWWKQYDDVFLNDETQLFSGLEGVCEARHARMFP